MEVFCPHCGWPSEFDFVFYERSYYHCPECDLIFCNRGKSVNEVLSYYREKYFDDHAQDQISGGREGIFIHAMNVIERFKSAGMLLDVGCGIGQLVKEARKRNWTALGVDPSEKSIEYARKNVGDYFICGTLDDIGKDLKFDCVTLINVLDHMVDGGRQLRKIYHLLKEGGIIYLRLPNGFFYAGLRRISSQFRYLNKINRYLVFHEYVVTPKAIRNCLIDYGFENIMVKGDRLSFSDCRQNLSIPTSFLSLGLKIFSWGTKLLEVGSRGKIVLSPSISVLGWKK
ncbi:MAG: class I SAM-dependent methyltransferase [Syntrophales bacterium]|nr:class I SAM-dependent methyltransferase [Syntrophales bacterium]